MQSVLVHERIPGSRPTEDPEFATVTISVSDPGDLISRGREARLLFSAHVTGDNLVSILTRVDYVQQLRQLAAEIDSKN